ncbi:hypothetical protein QQ054_00970 [Oscillatoria amoena NRMC-F 0135]|nr:hypothetical protein [Oscillatoria amoena NRMC-F 0135]
MSYAFNYHIQYRVKNTNMRNVINMRTLDRGDAVANFKRDFGLKHYLIERVFIPTPLEIQQNISLIQPVTNKEPQEDKAYYCECCTHSTFHSFAGYGLPINEGLEEPLVAKYTCNLCNTLKKFG